MSISAYLLYPMMAIILLWMWVRVRGKSLEQIVQTSADEHHALTDLFEDHPRGGSWPEFCNWQNNKS